VGVKLHAGGLSPVGIGVEEVPCASAAGRQQRALPLAPAVVAASAGGAATSARDPEAECVVLRAFLPARFT